MWFYQLSYFLKLEESKAKVFDKMVKQNIKDSVLTTRSTYKNPMHEVGIGKEKTGQFFSRDVSGYEKMTRSQNSSHTLFPLLSLMFSVHRRREGAYLLPL